MDFTPSFPTMMARRGIHRDRASALTNSTKAPEFCDSTCVAMFVSTNDAVVCQMKWFGGDEHFGVVCSSKPSANSLLAKMVCHSK